MDFMSMPYVGAGADGSLYVSLENRFFEVLRFPESGAPIETIANGPTYLGAAMPLEDGRTLMTSRVMDRTQMFVLTPGKETASIRTNGRTHAVAVDAVDRRSRCPGCRGAGHIEVAVMSVATGAILRRIPVTSAVNGMGASPDGRTLYFSAGGRVLAVAADDSGTTAAPVDLGPGDSLAVDPDTGDLIVKDRCCRRQQLETGAQGRTGTADRDRQQGVSAGL
jgi:hypothetical protein